MTPTPAQLAVVERARASVERARAAYARAAYVSTGVDDPRLDAMLAQLRTEIRTLIVELARLQAEITPAN